MWHEEHSHDKCLGQMRQHAPEDRKGRGGLLVQLFKGRTRQPLQIFGEMKGRVVGHLGGLWMTRLLSARERECCADYRIVCESPACSVGRSFEELKASVKFQAPVT